MRLVSDPALLRDTDRAPGDLMSTGAQVLAGIEPGGIPLVVALSAATGLPAGFVRRLPKPDGSRRQIEGIGITVPRTVLIGDVVRSSGQLLTVARALRMAGSPVTGAVCGPERPLGGRTVPAEHRVTVPPPRPTAVVRVMSGPDPLPPIVSADG
ncbi:orotate phosphoribosyltransferase [Kitasatospora sp. NPDC092948]|uniref:orotate phosphoribosyltransferase n=1 Tax=Kitasatospora sp. NPDC092948 TaxID=3364088 RepID=UPI00380D0941